VVGMDCSPIRTFPCHFLPASSSLSSDAMSQASDLSPFVSLGSLVLVEACLNEFDGILQGYLTDAYTMYAASANAPLAFLRGLLSGSFPIFGRQMFQGLGSNVSGSILASIASIFCFTALWFCQNNKGIRESSSYATHYKQ